VEVRAIPYRCSGVVILRRSEVVADYIPGFGLCVRPAEYAAPRLMANIVLDNVVPTRFYGHRALIPTTNGVVAKDVVILDNATVVPLKLHVVSADAGARYSRYPPVKDVKERNAHNAIRRS
jgi:hypothetical protein